MTFRWHMSADADTVHAIRDESIGKHGVKRLYMLCGRVAKAGPDDPYWEGDDMAGMNLTPKDIQFPQAHTMVGVGDFNMLREPCKRCLRIASK